MPEAILRLHQVVGNRATGALLTQAQSTVGRHRDPLGGLPVDAGVEAQIDRSRGGGKAVAPDVRRAAEGTLAADLGRVRVHDDARSDGLARSLQAKAFTTGNDIYFRKGGYDPRSGAGREVLAHELAHVAQQGGTVRRKLAFDRSQLAPLQSDKDLAKVLKLFDDLRLKQDSPVRKPIDELKLLKKIDEAIGKRLPKEPTGPAQDGTTIVLIKLKRALDLEAPKLAKLIEHSKVLDLGVAPEIVEQLSPEALQTLVAIDALLKKGDSKSVAAADEQFSALIGTMGKGTVNLLRSMLMRRHLGALNPKMARMLELSGFELEQTTVTDAMATLKAYSAARVTEIEKLDAAYPTRIQPPTMDPKEWSKIGVKLAEGDVHKPLLADLEGAAKSILAGEYKGSPLKPGEVRNPVQQARFEQAQAVAKQGADALRKAGLTVEEIAAILGYTTNLYGRFNTPLRGTFQEVGAPAAAGGAQNAPGRHRGVGDQGVRPRKKAAASSVDGAWKGGVNALETGQMALTTVTISGLKKLEVYRGPVFRHGRNFAGFAATNRVGGVVSDLAFMSTAGDQKGCDSGAEDHEVLEVIRSKTGRDVSLISAFGKGEREVLFFPGTRFRVTRVVRREDNEPHWPQDDVETQNHLKGTSKRSEIQLIVYKEEV